MTDLEVREALASLPGNVGYQELLKTLEELVNDAVELVVHAATEEQTLKAARNLQALFKYFHIFKYYPQNILTEFEEEKQLILESGEDPLFNLHRRELLKQIENNFEPNGSPKKGKK